VALLWLAGLLLACEEPAVRPNVLLISFDTLRPDHLGAYGYERPTSAQLDAFARRAVLFENAYAHAPKTAPSHMSLMTGLYPEAHQVRNVEAGGGALAAGTATLAERLSDAGYQTGAITDGGNVRGDLGFERGFERYHEGPSVGGAFGEAERALPGIARRREAGEPFFLFVHTYQIPDPYLHPPEYAHRFTDPGYAGQIAATHEQLFEPARRRWRESGRKDPFSPHHRLRARLFWMRVDERSALDRRHLVDLYDAGIVQADDQFGHFMGRLAALGLEEDTLVVLSSDHGEEFGEHSGFKHNDVYDEVLRSLLVVRFPGQRAGLRVAQPVGQVDVLPTVLQAVSLPGAELLPGRPLQRFLEEAQPAARAVFSQWPARDLHTLRSGRWKLIQRPGGAELFDLEGDPGERQDLSAVHRDRVLEAQRELDGQRAASRALRTGGPGPAPQLDEEARAQLEALGYLDEP
jgi:arylsulfatase A-like enzyme